MKYALLTLVGLVFGTGAAVAGGLVGDAFRAVGAKSIGDGLDSAHKQIKEANPVYKQIEEGTSKTVRKVFTETEVETLWPVLDGMIQASRQAALNDGTASMSEELKQNFRGFFDEDTLSRVRYRVGGGGDLSLQQNSFKYGDAIAITLIDVIVFIDDARANDAALWAHELRHVQQFRDWGRVDFAKRYIRDHEAVEQEARDTANRFVPWFQQNVQIAAAGNQGGYPGPGQGIPQPAMNNVCFIPAAGGCYVNQFVPVGTPCWCNSMMGPLQGMISQ
jgi:hypothetical protein